MTKTVKATMHLSVHPNTYKTSEDDEDFRYVMKSYVNSDDVIIATMKVEMEVPDINMQDRVVESLRNQQQTIKAEASLEVDNIEEQIQSMLALPAP